MAHDSQVYAVSGNKQSDQAEPSTANRGAGTVDMRVLIELQVIAYLLHQGFGVKEDLAQLRADVAASIT